MKLAALTIGLALVGCLVAAEARGQMFGSRSGFGSLGQGATKDSTGVGTVNFSERFIRGNRRPNSFIGGDAKDRRGFVGMQQGGQTGRVRPTISPVHETAPDANRTAGAAGRSRSGPYEPRLSVAFDVTRPPEEGVAQDLTHLLMSSPEFQSTSQIEVSVEGEIATLRGEVASERDRALAERLILFEPGIDSVRNELKVKSPSRRPAEYLPPLPGQTRAPTPKPTANAPR